MIRITPEQLKQAAKARRRGFTAAVISLAIQDGEHLVISGGDWSRLTLQYIRHRRGLGDIVHTILKPIVRGTRFENCSGCAKRREALNRLTR